MGFGHFSLALLCLLTDLLVKERILIYLYNVSCPICSQINFNPHLPSKKQDLFSSLCSPITFIKKTCCLYSKLVPIDHFSALTDCSQRFQLSGSLHCSNPASTLLNSIQHSSIYDFQQDLLHRIACSMVELTDVP
jgi:hypothetical protein